VEKMEKQNDYFIIRAWDYDYIFGYVSKITNKMFMLDDSCFALKFKTRADAEKTIKILKSTGTELNFSITETKGN
jgi:hypothetical protein